jgi:hypothetical protein
MRASPTFKNEWVTCRHCGKEEPKRNTRHFFCSANCNNKWRRANNIQPVIRKVDRTESDIFEWRCYPMGVL